MGALSTVKYPARLIVSAVLMVVHQLAGFVSSIQLSRSCLHFAFAISLCHAIKGSDRRTRDECIEKMVGRSFAEYWRFYNSLESLALFFCKICYHLDILIFSNMKLVKKKNMI